MKKLLLCSVALFAVAGCGGSGSTSYSDAQSVADAAGMSNCSPDTNVMSSDAVSCDQGRANWFKSSDALDGWHKVADAASSIGGAGVILYGSNWAIECSSKAWCDKAKTKLGGTLG